jgi:hypothetical protein
MTDRVTQRHGWNIEHMLAMASYIIGAESVPATSYNGCANFTKYFPRGDRCSTALVFGLPFYTTFSSSFFP